MFATSFRTLLLFLTVGLSFTFVNADPLTITGGSAGFSGGGGFPFLGLHFEAPNFQISGTGGIFQNGNANAAVCNPCTPGQSVSLGGFGFITHQDWTSSALVVINGTQYFNGQGTQIGAQGFFTGGLVTIPVITDPTITLTAPFSMTGGTTVTQGPSVFSVQFQGSGIATLTLIRNFEGTGYNYRSVNYVFSTPEPASVVLLVTGLTSAVFGLRRRL